MDKESLEHYYGDTVRILFIIAGIMNPKHKCVIFLNTIIPVIAFVFFEYYAVMTYIDLLPAEKTIKDIHGAFFWTHQILAIIFFFTTYLSTKTLRGVFLADKNS